MRLAVHPGEADAAGEAVAVVRGGALGGAGEALTEGEAAGDVRGEGEAAGAGDAEGDAARAARIDTAQAGSLRTGTPLCRSADASVA